MIAGWQHPACASVNQDVFGYVCAKCRQLKIGHNARRRIVYTESKLAVTRARLVADGLVVRHRIHKLIEICEWGSVSPLAFDSAAVTQLDLLHAATHSLVVRCFLGEEGLTSIGAAANECGTGPH